MGDYAAKETIQSTAGAASAILILGLAAIAPALMSGR
jgi:hypothetical protein